MNIKSQKWITEKPVSGLRIIKNLPQQRDWKTIQSIVHGAHYLLNQMIFTANTRSESAKGEPKVGGHSSASTSAVHILGALHLIVRRGFDFIANKPHASPTDHAYHYLLNLLLDKNLKPLNHSACKKAMQSLRAFPTKDHPHVFQSYHSAYDPDHQNFLPSGTVGIPPVVLAYLALAWQFAQNQGYTVPPSHFWSLIGDSEFREGSLFEALPDMAERQVGSLTWIIDYNRQSLDGHRTTHPSLQTDDKRIENTFLANGWEVIQVKHGEKRRKLFQEEKLFQNFFENKLNDIELQILLQLKNPKTARSFILKKSPDLKTSLSRVSDSVLVHCIQDLGGHDIKILAQAMKDSKKNKNKPCCIIAHTIKGWGLKMAGQPDNHSALPDKEELLQLKNQTKFKESLDDFPKFKAESSEAFFLKNRGEKLLTELKLQKEMKIKNKKYFFANSFSSSTDDFKNNQQLGISLKFMSYPHTQWMLGQWISKLSRIASSSFKDLTEEEKPFFKRAQMLVGLSPDVGTSTNLSFSMDNKIYNSAQWKDLESNWNILHKKSPQLHPSTDPAHRFLRFEIAEAASLSCLAAFGKMKHFTGIPFLPLMSIYDFFIKRALDQYFYSLYWESSFILAGTPSGITLSSEGAQHGWKSDFQIPGQICWEPYFCLEMDWILTEALFRHTAEKNQGRTGVLVRAVTRGVDQKKFLHYLRKQTRFKKENKKLHPKNQPIEQALDESKAKTIDDKEILSIVRDQVLQGAYPLIHFKGYEDYQPRENVIHIFAMGALGTEACSASTQLLKHGVYANVIIVTSPDLLLGGLAYQNQYHYLKSGLDLDKNVPIISVHDGEPGLLDNIGSILGKTQEVLAVRKHSLCGKPSEVNAYHGLSEKNIIKTALQLLQL